MYARWGRGCALFSAALATSSALLTYGDTCHGYTHYGALSSAALATSSGSAELAPAPKSSRERKASTVRGEAHTCE